MDLRIPSSTTDTHQPPRRPVVFAAVLLCTLLLWIASSGPWRAWETQSPGASWVPTQPNGDAADLTWGGVWLRPLALVLAVAAVSWVIRTPSVAVVRIGGMVAMMVAWLLGLVVLEPWVMQAALRLDGWQGAGLGATRPDGTGPVGTLWRVSVGWGAVLAFWVLLIGILITLVVITGDLHHRRRTSTPRQRAEFPGRPVTVRADL